MPIINFKKIIQKDPLPMSKYVLDLWTSLADIKAHSTKKKNSAVEDGNE
jgi:hypothetical protein